MRCTAVAVLLLGCISLAAAQCDFQAEIEGIARDDSLVISATPDNRCLVGPTGENCIQGTGKRDLIRFTTLIRNVGTEDCIVGQVPDCPPPGVIPADQGPFHFATCHKHWHLQNYADYYLTEPVKDWQAQGMSDQCSGVPECAPGDEKCRVLSGHKTGFCLMDSLCGDGTEWDALREKYTCSYQGITAGCLDAYVADLPCQWIDVTNIQNRWKDELCLCVTVNANAAALNGSNIAGEINKANNRICAPMVFDQLPKFQAQNESFVNGGDYLDPANQCLGWNDGVVSQARESAFLPGSRPLGQHTAGSSGLAKRKADAARRQKEAEKAQVAMKRAAARRYIAHRQTLQKKAAGTQQG